MGVSGKLIFTKLSNIVSLEQSSHKSMGMYVKATTGGKMFGLGPWVVALIISLQEHFRSWNLIMKLKGM